MSKTSGWIAAAGLWQEGTKPPKDGTKILAIYDGEPHVVAYEEYTLRLTGYHERAWCTNGKYGDIFDDDPVRWAFINL